VNQGEGRAAYELSIPQESKKEKEKNRKSEVDSFFD